MIFFLGELNCSFINYNDAYVALPPLKSFFRYTLYFDESNEFLENRKSTHQRHLVSGYMKRLNSTITKHIQDFISTVVLLCIRYESYHFEVAYLRLKPIERIVSYRSVQTEVQSLNGTVQLKHLTCP